MVNLIKRIESYISDYVALADPATSLPIALWILGTFCFEQFDAFGYLVITAPVKRCGKTRLLEMISFCCSKPRNFAALTGAALFRLIQKEKPTILVDEAEEMSREAASTMRSVLNVGYRKGATIPRVDIDGKVAEFETYCPKGFALIGDVFDTLRDRSIVITMQRGEPRKRFTLSQAQDEGAELRRDCESAVKDKLALISEHFHDHSGLDFLFDREEEIWTPLFILCAVFAKDRLDELSRIAADLATSKTAEARRYINLKGEERSASQDEYGKRLLLDLYGVFVSGGFKAISSKDALEQLKAIPTAPWRAYRGAGLTVHAMSDMLSTFGVRPVNLSIGKGREGRKVLKGYKYAMVSEATGKL